LTADGIIGPASLEKLGLGASPVVIKEDVVIPKGGPINLEKLKGHIPEAVIVQIPTVMEKFQINTPLRLAHFLAQCGHESGGFKATQENLNYSADGGRMGNGGEETKEGYKFRGRGYIQLTGKENYTSFAKSIGEDTVANPDLVATKYALASAGWFFSKNGLNAISDKGADDATVTAVTKRVNGGTIGLPDRIKHFKEYYHLLA
jgi:putative chitinase